MAKVYPDGIRNGESYCFNTLEMCQASERWQASRLRQFDRFVGFGFQVIQLDEFPIQCVWHLEPSQSREHLHRPGDADDEWSKALQFVTKVCRLPWVTSTTGRVPKKGSSGTAVRLFSR